MYSQFLTAETEAQRGSGGRPKPPASSAAVLGLRPRSLDSELLAQSTLVWMSPEGPSTLTTSEFFTLGLLSAVNYLFLKMSAVDK